ncbi:MAG: ArsR/SmtB family transcription factor [Halobacteriaceae archaeon]
MSRLFPFRSSAETDDRDPRLVEIDEEVADDVFAALSSRTARVILAALYEEPRTASELADIADTSIQNVQYHIRKFEEADLVEVVDTWYSDRGSEMKVYAPTDESLVVFAGRNTTRSLRKLLSRFVGAVVVAVVVLVAVGRFAGFGPANWTGGPPPAPTTTALDATRTTTTTTAPARLPDAGVVASGMAHVTVVDLAIGAAILAALVGLLLARPRP